MATIKSFTSLEQSRKLAEILPLESADMIYTMVNGRCTPFIRIETIEEMDEDDVLCWSLAALLSVLPNGIVINKDSKNGIYHVSSTHIGTYIRADNPIDACVAMIIKLHELKML